MELVYLKTTVILANLQKAGPSSVMSSMETAKLKV